MTTPEFSTVLKLVAAVALALSIGAWLSGFATAGQAIGLLFMFCLGLIPSTIFVGYVLGSLLNWPEWARLVASALGAGVIAYSAVFHTGPASDIDCVPAGPGIYNDC